MATLAPLRAPTTLDEPADASRWLALVFIALAQLMLALDATIVNIALPSAQAALQFSDAQRQWVITAYTLAFGGLLLLGGRLSDYFGRRRTFLVGLGGFALASALSGGAPNLPILVATRALQGAFGALLAPTALALLTLSFVEPRERARAFAVYGTIAGGGGALGLLLGGTLTQYLDWRWCLYVNVPVAAIAALGGWRLLPDARAQAKPGLDVLGGVLGSAGLVALVYACSQFAHLDASAPLLLILSALLLAAFVVHERSTTDPLLPLRILAHRQRAGAYLCVALAIMGMFGLFLFLTYYFQVVLHFTPVQAGLAFLPLSGAVLLGGGGIASRLMHRLPPRTLMVPGFAVAAAGMALLTGLHVDSSYLTQVLPAEILLGLGMGCVMVPASSLATAGADRRDAGVASAVLNTSQQVGASLGTAVLNSVAAGASAAALAMAFPPGEALVYGYATAAAWAAAILVLGAILAALLIDSPASSARG